MKTFAKANIRRRRQGHVFQGRYKAVPVAGEAAADAHYFKCGTHLKPKLIQAHPLLGAAK